LSTIVVYKIAIGGLSIPIEHDLHLSRTTYFAALFVNSYLALYGGGVTGFGWALGWETGVMACQVSAKGRPCHR